MKYAYITILNSDNDIIYLNTLILAESIRNTNTESDILLLHDFSIPEYKLDILRKYFTKLISVKKISFDELFKIKNYHKIIYINNNLYVNKNIDDLFGLDTPSARIINDNVDTTLIVYNPNETITKNTNFNDLNKKYNYYVMNDSDDLNINDDEYNYIHKNIYVINYNAVVSPSKYINNLNLMQKNNELKVYYPYYKGWIDTFKKSFKNYKELGINIIHPNKQLTVNINDYLKRKYKNLKYINMTDEQKNKLNKKLNTPIAFSHKNMSKNFTYRNIIDNIGNGIFISGGLVRNLFNNEEINDVDIFYSIDPDVLDNKLKKINGLIYYRSKRFPHFFRIGRIGMKEMDMSYINRIDTQKNSMSNALIIDLDNFRIIDVYGDGAFDAKEKIWRKPNNISYDNWLVQNGVANVLLGRMIKFIMIGYKTIQKERALIYNDWFYNKGIDDYNMISSKQYFVKDKQKKYDFIEKDVDNLGLSFSGKDMVDKLKSLTYEKKPFIKNNIANVSKKNKNTTNRTNTTNRNN